MGKGFTFPIQGKQDKETKKCLFFPVSDVFT